VIPETQERLDGWKSIAGYLKRTIRTVQRWEKLEGLPVHRIGHASSASVFAYPGELDLWWNERKSRIDDPSEPATSPSTTAAGPLSFFSSRSLVGRRNPMRSSNQHVAPGRWRAGSRSRTACYKW
jgi:hypothetical protein